MTSQSASEKRSHTKKWIVAVALLAPACFLGAIPWLEEQPDGVAYLFGGIAATITVLCSFALAITEDRKLDEWHRAASRFSNQWGWLAGVGVVALLLSLPPIHSLVITTSAALAGVTDPDPTLVLMAFTLGFMAVTLAQMLCTLALSAIWRARMSRAE